MISRSRWLGVLVSIALLMMLTPWVASGEDIDRQDANTPYMLVIDTSGSMNEKTNVAGVTDTSGAVDTYRSRLDLAKSSLQDVANSMGQSNPLGVFSYPGGPIDSEGCYPGEVIARPTIAEDRTAVSSRLRGLSAGGNTPTGPALREAAQVLKDTHGGHGVILLFSDGESNCGAIPVCEVAQQLVNEGHQVTVNTVGLNLSESAKQELSCVADVTGGKGMFSDDAAQLQDMIKDSILPELQVDVQMPNKIAGNIGADQAGTTATVNVGVSGNGMARDIRAVLTIYDPDGSPGAITTTRPVQYFGNLDSTDNVSRKFLIRPSGSQSVPSGTYTWKLTVVSENTRPVELSGELVVDDRLTRDDLGEIFADVEHVVVMGDSYASGEGAASAAEPYYTEEERCHRTNNNYGTVLFGKDSTTTIACSGAVASDFLNESTETHFLIWERFSVGSQMEKLNDLMDDHPVDAVLLSIGGNDIGFGDVVANCVVTWACGFSVYDATATDHQAKFDAEHEITKYGASAQAAVYGALKSIDRHLNDTKQVAERGDREAPVVVAPYPRIIPPVGNFDRNMNAGTCFPGVDGRELELLNALIDSLNSAVHSAVDSLRSEGRPVYYAETVVGAMQPNHTLCDPDPWVVNHESHTFSPVEKSILVAKNIQAKLWVDGKRNMQQLVHPNENGHTAMARAIAAWSLSDSAQLPVVVGISEREPHDPIFLMKMPGIGSGFAQDITTSAYYAVRKGGEVANSIWGSVTGAAEATKSASKKVLVAGAKMIGSVDWIEIATQASPMVSPTMITEKFNYRLGINSEPMVLGFGEADSLDQVLEGVHLPSSIPAGDHTLVLHVFDDEGQIHIYESEVTVMSSGTYLAYLTLIIGSILLAFAMIGLGILRLSNRKKASA